MSTADNHKQQRWSVAGATVRGAAHERIGLPNQDAIARWTPADGGFLPSIVAIADGHGGPRHFRSAVGARIAVDVTVRVLRELSARLESADSTERARIASVELPGRIVFAWTENARSHLASSPFTADELGGVEAAEGEAALAALQADPLLAYGATLLAAVVLQGCILLTQLGDGDILAVANDGVTVRPVPSDERLVGNLTTSICRAGAESDFRSVVLTDRPALLLLSTDGYANSFKTDKDFLQVGSDFLGMIRNQGMGAVEGQLAGILEHASSNGSGDDITLGLLYCSNGAAAPTYRGGGEASTTDSAEGIASLNQQLADVQRRVSLQQKMMVAAFIIALAAIGWSARQQLSGLFGSHPAIAVKPLPNKDSGVKPRDVDADKPTEPAEVSAEATVRPKIKDMHATRAELGIEVSALIDFPKAPPEQCVVVAKWEGKEKPASSPTISVTGSERQHIQHLLVPYPLEKKEAKAMKGEDAKVSLTISCNGEEADRREEKVESTHV